MGVASAIGKCLIEKHEEWAMAFHHTVVYDMSHEKTHRETGQTNLSLVRQYFCGFNIVLVSNWFITGSGIVLEKKKNK